MFRKQFKPIKLIFSLIKKSGLIILALFFAFVFLLQSKLSAEESLPTTLKKSSPSIADYIKKIESEKEQDYLKFKTEWFNFLNRKQNNIPDNLTPAYARKVTEDFFLKSGGIKAKFAEASKNNTYGFTLTRPAGEELRKAGFHRTRHSIFMDIQAMNSNEWLMVFVHEVAHSLDSELIAALPVYNDKDLILYFINLGQKNIQLQNLNHTDRLALDKWLFAGLNRGFLAEYRAWLLTYLVYEEGLKDGTFQPVEWLENIKRNKPAHLDIKTYILRYLSNFWTDPNQNIFSYAYIQQALSELRLKIWSNPEMINLGSIEKIIL